MNQEQRVLNYIKSFNSITPLDAFRDLGITKLATVVSNLKKKGIIFYQSLDYSKNRYGETCHYMRYWLDKEIFLRDTEGLING